MAQRVLVIGACGDIGQGIARGALAQGFQVVATGRNADRLAQLYDGSGIATLVGDVTTARAASALWNAAQVPFGGLDAIVISVNAPNAVKPLLAFSADELAQVFSDNLLTHFNACAAIIPHLTAGAMLIGIGGGTADFILPKMAQLSMMQAAQRMFYRGLAKENKGGPHIRELMLISMINGARKRDIAEPHWVLDTEVGDHVCAIINDPDAFPGPILRLESREQVGKPEPSKAVA
jgi:NAD(P)-dependent dehydrogenase (short-subunit alcohol dehydrogenase family)